MRCVARQIIEKRRRDRINNSLSELRRLVPSAFEKQVRGGEKSAEEKPDKPNSVWIFKTYLDSFCFPFSLSPLWRAQPSWRKQRFCRWPWTIWRCFMLLEAKVRAGYPKRLFISLFIFLETAFGCMTSQGKKNFGSRQTKCNKHSTKMFHVTPAAFKTQEKRLIRIM